MFGRNFGGRFHQGGAGFGFRGSSPPSPYIGQGRGGLPRCHYPGLSRWTDVSTRDEELGFLKGRAEVAKRQLEDIEHRIQALEKKE